MTPLAAKTEPADPNDYDILVDLWEASVRATHHFLSESDIIYFRPLIPDYFPLVRLTVARDSEGSILGFVGVAENKIEMLFVHPSARGAGVGRLLLEHAVVAEAANVVDVNEQNEQAVGFYRRMGFDVESRSPVDSLGKPYPLLHMRLSTPADRA